MHWYLYPFSLIYGAVVQFRNKFFDWGWIESKKFNIPVISVGNITVGGTGKTPHIEYLLNVIDDKYSAAIISRGYKRKTKGYIEVKTQSNVSEVGDEPLQIKRKFKNSIVIVDEKRVHAIEKITIENTNIDVVLLDDAYQHRYVKPGLNILLVDYNRPITKDFIFPVGRLREPAFNRNRADVVIVTKCPDDMSPIDIRIMQNELNLFPYQSLFFSSLRYNNLKAVFSKKNSYNKIEDLKGVSVLVVTGIANPKPLHDKLKNVGANIFKLSFSDHHEFSQSDLNRISNSFKSIEDKNKVIVCTEKDAVRLKTAGVKKSITNLPFYSLPIEVVILNCEESEFKEIIMNYIRK